MKISERANRICCDSYGAPILGTSERLGVLAALRALDEWQASVEERLASIGLGLVPGKCTEQVLASGSLPARTAFPIADPGQSKFGREPENIPE